jgi:DNA-binding protein H-NS
MRVQHPGDTEKLKANSVSRDGVMAGNVSIPSVGNPADVQDDREKATDGSHLPDLGAMDFEELWVMHQQITKILADRIVAEKQELENRLAKLNQMDVAGEEDANQSAEDSTSRRKYPKVHPKYFNPQSPSETWSGRGKQPRWLVAALKSGHGLDEFRIVETSGKEEE